MQSINKIINTIRVDKRFIRAITSHILCTIEYVVLMTRVQRKWSLSKLWMNFSVNKRQKEFLLSIAIASYLFINKNSLLFKFFHTHMYMYTIHLVCRLQWWANGSICSFAEKIQNCMHLRSHHAILQAKNRETGHKHNATNRNSVSGLRIWASE